jgi:hypothetical protein
MLRLQICTLTSKRSAVLAGCQLLTLLFLAWIYFTEESINAHFLSVLSGLSTVDQTTTYHASEGNPKSVAKRNTLTVSK